MKDATRTASPTTGGMSLLARVRLAAGIALAVLLAGAWVWSRWSGPSAGVAGLEEQAREQARQLEQQCRAYAPARPVRLDDLDANAVALLEGLPGVARVVRNGPEHKPSVRIVHLCDAPLQRAEGLR